ncbi:hypothetical protein ACIRP3_43765 [Streptomyces sp. NPDC101209]|uniref:hypothetical protein n=1 Tax=Streptomyces sp. NPDC101209 TaxID=3366129 RepID=UPI0038128B82
MTAEGQVQQREAEAKLPKATRDLVTHFEADMDQAVKDDLRYDYRVRLVPIVGKKTDADLAVNFVNFNDLTEEERKIMTEAGRTGTVITKGEARRGGEQGEAPCVRRRRARGGQAALLLQSPR